MNEIRTACYDSDLEIEAYRFKGLKQKFPNHFHDYYVIGFIEKGERYLLCREREYVIQPGDILLFNPGDNHTCQQMGDIPLDYRCINIQPDIMQKTVSEILGACSLPVFTQNVLFKSELSDSLRELHRMISDQEKDFKKEEVFLFLLEQLLNEYSGTANPAEKDEPSAKIQAVCGFLNENFADIISLNQLSEMAGQSKYHLLHSFTKQMGISPYSYLETIRINHAKKLLEIGESPAEVAFSTGFHDQSHFTTFFKKFIGLTPRQYSMIFQNNQEEK